ncbi:MAG TPA: histidine kinase [Firmicutes bacterium]|nr:histidine kinase [Bacillota bacterium]
MKTVSVILKEKGQGVWSISPKSTVFEAVKSMSEKEVGALMVLDEQDMVAGIITERDYARKVILKGKRSESTLVEEIMTPIDKMYTVKPELTVEDAMVLITAKRVRHLPVFENNQLTGIISIGDLVKAKIAEQEMLIEQLSNYIAGRYA